MKFLYSIFLILTFSISINANETNEKDVGPPPNGITLALQQYAWDRMWRELTTEGKPIICSHKDPKKGLFGIEFTLIEPLYIVDATIYANEFSAAGTKVGKENPSKRGLFDLSDAGGIYIHILKFPLMNLLLGKTNLGGFLHFDKSRIRPVYIGNIDFMKWSDILSLAMHPEKVLYSSIVGSIMTGLTCPAYETLDKLSPDTVRNSIVGQTLRGYIDAAFFGAGCLGIFPSGTFSINTNPINGALLATMSIMSDLFSKRSIGVDLSMYQTVKSVLNGYNQDIYCSPMYGFALPLTQYTAQLLYPTVSKPHEVGISPLAYAFKNKAGQANKNIIFILSQRRDFAAFAYSDTPEKEQE